MSNQRSEQNTPLPATSLEQLISEPVSTARPAAVINLDRDGEIPINTDQVALEHWQHRLQTIKDQGDRVDTATKAWAELNGKYPPATRCLLLQKTYQVFQQAIAYWQSHKEHYRSTEAARKLLSIVENFDLGINPNYLAGCSPEIQSTIAQITIVTWETLLDTFRSQYMAHSAHWGNISVYNPDSRKEVEAEAVKNLLHASETILSHFSQNYQLLVQSAASQDEIDDFLGYVKEFLLQIWQESYKFANASTTLSHQLRQAEVNEAGYQAIVFSSHPWPRPDVDPEPHILIGHEAEEGTLAYWWANKENLSVKQIGFSSSKSFEEKRKRSASRAKACLSTNQSEKAAAESRLARLWFFLLHPMTIR
jgi:hypothetical protein